MIEMRIPKALQSVTFRVAFCSACTWFVYWKMDGLISVVLLSPLWGVLLAKPILEGLGTYFGWVKKQPYIPWQGRYYEFEGTHVRVYEDDDGRLWFCDKDVLKVLGQKPSNAHHVAYGEADYRVVEGAGVKAFSEAAVLRVVSRVRHPSTGKFKFWLEREVLAPHHRKR